MDFEIEEDLFAHSHKFTYQVGPFGCQQLQADLVEVAFVAELVHQGQCVSSVGEVKSHDDRGVH